MADKEQLEMYRHGEGYDFSPAVGSFKRAFSSSDILIANLETPVAGESLRYSWERYSFNCPQELPAALKAVGVTTVTTANNHCLDRGIEGLRQTLKTLDDIGLQHTGTYEKKEKAYLIQEVHGIKIGIVAFTYGTNAFVNQRYLQEDQKYMVNLLQDQELADPLVRMLWVSNSFPVRCARRLARKLHIGQFHRPVNERTERNKKMLRNYKAAIQECQKEGADYIIACLHIGGQYNDEPTDYTKKICALSRELGVNAVIANHEHVIHPIDHVYISDASFCIYSLGNMWSVCGVTIEPYDKLAQYSAAVNLDLARDEDGKIKAEYSIILFCNHLDENGKVITEPFSDHFERMTGVEKRDAMKDYQLLMNRVCMTNDKEYPLRREYKIVY